MQKKQQQFSTKNIVKTQKRDFQQKKHHNIFEENKSKEYFDESSNQWEKMKYYERIDMMNPNYEMLHYLLSTTFNHARRRQNLFTIIDRQPDHTLRCVYSGETLSDNEGNFLQKCDEQHSFPQSFQRGSKSGTGRDMHAIFAASKHANGSRGNIPFGNFGICVESDKYGKLYKDGKLKTYEPSMNNGAVARASLYILTCYKNCANQHYLPRKCLQWLISTASESEVSEWEKHRNQELFRLQGNRNPFIDFPEWARIIDFSAGWQKNSIQSS